MVKKRLNIIVIIGKNSSNKNKYVLYTGLKLKGWRVALLSEVV